MKLFSGNANKSLAEEIARYLDISLGQCVVKRFADQEIFVEIQENVRGEDVFILQSTSYPANDHLMELLILIDAARSLPHVGLPLFCPISAMPARIVSPARERPYLPNWSPI